jgi:hypothetical protein
MALYSSKMLHLKVNQGVYSFDRIFFRFYFNNEKMSPEIIMGTDVSDRPNTRADV